MKILSSNKKKFETELNNLLELRKKNRSYHRKDGHLTPKKHFFHSEKHRKRSFYSASAVIPKKVKLQIRFF